MKRIHLEEFSVEGGRLILRGATCHRARNVLRVRPGEALVGSDGRGTEYALTVEEVNPEQVTGRIDRITKMKGESPLQITLAQAVSRPSRMDLVVQKATELGVGRIVPLLAEHSVSKLRPEQSGARRQRWEKIAAEAVAQCRRAAAPVIAPPVMLEDFLRQAAAPLRLLLHHGPGTVTFADLPALNPGAVEVIVGPEGGWSFHELESCRLAGFVAVSLGPRVLRTETAGLVALALLQQRWGDLA
jgi:16S rRNA (uracil1498-N3)-methyltransferase